VSEMSEMPSQWDHFIDGRFMPPASGAYNENINPATQEALPKVASGSGQDVDAAVKAAQAALAEWRQRRPIERGRVLLKIAAKIREHSDRLAKLEASEAGKPAWQAPMEVEIAAQYFEFYGGLVNLYQGEVIDLGADYHSYTRREPFGLVGIILPWNVPINQGARGIAPALAAGNVVIAKPSEFTSATLVELARIAYEECDLPKGVLNVVLGLGDEVGKALVSHEAIRKIAFTGSVRAAKEIGKIAAERILPLTLELGGKSPNIIFEDADLALAIPGAIQAFVLNAGQVCLSGTRALVQRSIYDQVLKGIKAGVEQIKVGAEADAMVGAITTKAQYEKVQNYFEIAKKEGHDIITGGEMTEDYRNRTGWFVPPTIYANVDNHSRIAQEEIFGPVLAVIPFEDEADAIRLANETDYGLAAGIWTEHLGRAHRVAAALEAGQIYVNQYQAGGVETPLGGFKQSGYGREKGIEALHCYTQLKCVTIKL